jgi:hypothetical protein
MKVAVTNVLGRARDWRPIVSSIILSSLFMMYIFYVGSLFRIDIYHLIDRTTYYVYLHPNYFVNPFFDSVILASLFASWIALGTNKLISISSSLFLAILAIAAFSTGNSLFIQVPAAGSIPVVGFILILSLRSPKFKSLKENKFSITYISITLIIMAAISIYLSLSRTAASEPGNINDPFLMLYLTLSYLSPVMMFLIGFSVFFNFLAKPLITKFRISKILTLDFSHDTHMSNKGRYLILFMLLSIFLVLVPHFNPAREDHKNVSVDVTYYTQWINELDDSETWDEIVYKLFVDISGGDRPLSLFLMFILAKISPNNVSEILEIVMPIILSPALVLAIFYLTRELTSNDKIAMLAALLSPVSFQILIGTYSGYYSNWPALIFGYISLVFLLKFLKGNRKYSVLLAYGGLTAIVLFLHSYTWTVLTIFTIVFITVSGYTKLYPSRQIFIVSLVIVSFIVFDMGRTNLGIGSGGIGRDLLVIEGTETGLDQLEMRWNNLVRTVQVYVGGINGNFFFLFTILIGTILLFNTTGNSVKLFVLTFISLAIIPLFFGNKDIMARIFYDIPFQIPAAIALFWIQGKGSIGKIAATSIIVCLIAVAIRISTNY